MTGVVGVLLLLGIYALDAGHGFVKDDFGWIATSRVERLSDLTRLLQAATGFFRPVVSLSFSLEDAAFGLHPRPYGLTNLALLLACVAAVSRLLCAVQVRPQVALASAFLWALNFQAINMAVLWISGRTALLVTLCAAASATAWLRGRYLIAGAMALMAMWSKEEALVLPVIFSVWHFLKPGVSGNVWRGTWTSWLAAAITVAVRTWAGAFTPASAPESYQYRVDLATFASNLLSYADRVGTTPFVALIVVWLIAGLPPMWGRSPSDALASRARILMGLAWLALAFAPTILLPVRSSLYAVLPSVGAAFIAADLIERVADRAAPAAFRRSAIAMMLILMALLPVYRLRNQRYVEEAELSAAVVAELTRILEARPAGGLVVVRDTRDARPTAEQAFGPLADRAAQLVSGGKLRMWIDPPPAELAGVTPPDLRTAIATLTVKGGRVAAN